MARKLSFIQRMAIKALGLNSLPNFNYLNQLVGGTTAFDGQNLDSAVRDGYAGNGTVYSIIRLIADKVKEPAWGEYKVVDANAYKEYQAAVRAIKSDATAMVLREVKDMRERSLQPVRVGGKISELVKKPNPVDSWRNIIDNWAVYKLSTGNNYLYANILDMGANKGKPQELWIMPSQWMQIIININDFPLRPIGYRLQYGDAKVFLKNQILHDKYPNPRWSTTGEHLIGLSPLEAGHKELSRDNKGKVRAVSSYEHGGPPGIVSIDAGPNADEAFLQQQVNALKARMAEYESEYNANKPAFSGYPAKWTQLGLSPVDLALSELEGYNVDALCNLYSVPSILLNRQGAGTYNNWLEARKQLVTDCVLPLLTDIRDSFNRMCETEWNMGDTVLDFDMSCFKELEADRQKQVQWLNTAWWLPPQMKYDLMGLDVPDYIPKEDLQQIVIPSGLSIFDPANINLPPELNPYAK